MVDTTSSKYGRTNSGIFWYTSGVTIVLLDPVSTRKFVCTPPIDPLTNSQFSLFVVFTRKGVWWGLLSSGTAGLLPLNPAVLRFPGSAQLMHRLSSGSLCKCPGFPHVQHLAGFVCSLLGLFGFVREDTKDWSSFSIVSSFFSK